MNLKNVSDLFLPIQVNIMIHIQPAAQQRSDVACVNFFNLSDTHFLFPDTFELLLGFTIKIKLKNTVHFALLQEFVFVFLVFLCSCFDSN